MNYLQKIKKFLLRYTKKEKGGKQPKTREVKQWTANFVVYGILGLLFIAGFFGSLRSIGLSNQVQNLKETVVAVEEKSKNKKTDNSLDVSRVQYYMNNFIYYYINYSEDTADQRKAELENYYSFSNASMTDDVLDVSRVQYYMNNFIYYYINYSEDTADQRKAELENYYSFSNASMTDDVRKSRTLQTQRLISVEKEKDYYVALMRVGYEVDKKPYQMNLAVPFQMQDGLLAIVSQPYTVADDLYLGKSKTFEKKTPYQVKDLSKEQIRSIQKFLPVFFDKYALSNKTDLKLLMKILCSFDACWL